MKKLFLFAALMTTAVMNAKDVEIFHASFTAASQTSMAGHTYGSPEVLWTNTKYNYGTAEDCTAPTIQAELNVPGKKAADSKGRNILTAPMTAFETPWASKINEVTADSLVWMFNMRYNYDYTNGFDNQQRGIAAVLCMDGADMMTANGYAIVSNASCFYKLIRIDGGLSANDHVTELASTAKLTKNDGTGTSNKRYLTLRIVYIPVTNTWKMYYFANTSNAYVTPDNVVSWTLAGTMEDATHTNKEMTHFGFMNNYVQGASFDASLFVKNFQIMAYGVAETPTGIDNFNTRTPSRKVLRNGQLIILRNDMEYNVLGQSIH